MKKILEKKLTEFEKSEMKGMVVQLMEADATKPFIANCLGTSVHKIKRLLANQSCTFNNSNLLATIKLYQARIRDESINTDNNKNTTCTDSGA